MDRTPKKHNRPRSPEADAIVELKESRRQTAKPQKPPSITPRRFNRFFNPQIRNPGGIVQTSRAALRVLSGSNINSRNAGGNTASQREIINGANTPRGKKRKLSIVTSESNQSSPVSRVSFPHSSQEIRSSPTIPERRTPSRRVYQDFNISDDEEAETDIELEVEDDDHETEPPPRIVPYQHRSTAAGLLSTRISGRKARVEAPSSNMWQHQTGHFYSSPKDVNESFSRDNPALPFSLAACHTNPIIAAGDEEGNIKIIDSSADNVNGLTKIFFVMRPHDNALMDLEFSPDDSYLATACGDQSCQIIDMRTQQSLYRLGGHRCSVKRIAFQPGSGNNILASCGRDGQLNFWDLRCSSDSSSVLGRRHHIPDSMVSNMKFLSPTHGVREAHAPGLKTARSSKANLVPGRADFSVTSLSFLGESRPHLLVTASEIDATIKVWDIRTHNTNMRRTQNPLSCADQPKSHAVTRHYGVSSVVVSTDGSTLYALSRDYTVYAYSTAHLILGSSPHLSRSSKPSKLCEGGKRGLGPIYGLRHPSLRVQTFWPRLAIRKATDSQPELLAVGSTEDCAILFPTDARYLTKSNMSVPSRHVGAKNPLSTSRPSLNTRSTSTLSISGSFSDDNDSNLPIYHHGTPLIRCHDKEVTSLAWTSEGSLITASDDYTVRCWREDPENARRMRDQGEKNGERWRKGWADVGVEGFDDEC